MHCLLPLLAAGALVPLAHAHVGIFHPSMWGLDVVDGDNRPVNPLINLPFDQWWFHGHLNNPPAPGKFFELPAGGAASAEIACAKSITSFADDGKSWGGKVDNAAGNVCPGEPGESFKDTIAEFHTTGFDDLTDCALAITYESDVFKVQPEDFAVFSVNHTCADYMNGFRCNVTGAASDVPIAPAQVPRRCGHEGKGGTPSAQSGVATPGNCTYGAKQPFYWFQVERNNMFEGSFAPPFYTDLYNFRDGAQDDIFADSYDFPLPAPGADQTAVPKFHATGGGARPDGQGADALESTGGLSRRHYAVRSSDVPVAKNRSVWGRRG